MNSSLSTHIVILAAGRSTRMGGQTPKLFIQIGGKPVIASLVENLQKSNIGPIHLIINNDTGPKIREMIGDSCDYIVQKEQLGTGHALGSAKDNLLGKTETIIAMNGDHPFTEGETLKKMLAQHQEEQATLTMLTVYVPNYKGINHALYDYGRIIRDKDGKIEAIRELKDCSDQEKDITEVNAQYFCYQTDWLWDNIDKLKNNNRQKEYYITDLIAMAIEQRQKVSSFSITNVREVIGINTPQQLELAKQAFNQPPTIVSENK